MLKVQLVGDRELVRHLQAMPNNVRTALELKVSQLALQLERKEKIEHLSGPTGEHTLSVGKNTTGHTGGQLRASVFSEMVSSGASVTGRVAFSSDVPYAAIHEFGGKVDVPEIVPVKAKALHWVGKDGADVFRKRARAHTVQIPERATLRTSLEEMTPDIERGLDEAVSAGLAKT